MSSLLRSAIDMRLTTWSGCQHLGPIGAVRGQPLCQRLPPSPGLPAPQRLDEFLFGHHQDRFGQRDNHLALNDLDPDHAFDPRNSAT
jgi:hypothetical protein